MNIIHPRIKLFHDIQEAVTSELALADTYQIMKEINKLSGKSSGWHLPGYTLEEIQENNVFNDNDFTEYAINQFKDSFGEGDIIKTLFDVPGDEKINNNIIYMSSNSDINRLGKSNVSINLNFERGKFYFQSFIEFIKSLISTRNSPFLLLDARGYSLKQKQVFPDRVYAGWMLYLPTEIDPTLVPMAEEIISIPDKEGCVGTLIITTKNIFDIENQEHINKANDIEICLRDLQLLPLMTEI
ncbi:immunity 52 family protein [Xenorhabdus sp. XENO-1]|uniref:immunity 52 family protein n=1 Tax=Xenorhabdus bovienii TaxID=40576 RepID=UPI0020CA611D|nr:immunity 52 family protein [Xenorhabdus bovienii]MCP9269519.1 immunity 52 family protein [Xenorhabdus bovienii subsp. africana]